MGNTKKDKEKGIPLGCSDKYPFMAWRNINEQNAGLNRLAISIERFSQGIMTS